ncbi:MAG: FecR domain-containing protein [Chloracidobacterium sp.]|nr:FecR domain-containing protein [Chloracidobacterium sp.]
MTIFHNATSKFPRRCVRSVTTALLSLLAFYSLALADDSSYRVARISLVEGEVSYQPAKEPGDSGKDWFDATLNLPIEENDQLYSGSDGRAEIQVSGHNFVRIDHDTNLRLTQFSPGAIQMALPVGSAYFRIDSLDKRRFDVFDAKYPGVNDPVYFEVDTPVAAITFVKEGVYRIDVRDDGSTEVIVRHGDAEIYNQQVGTVAVREGRRVIVESNSDPRQISGLKVDDDWDRWNDSRDKGLNSTPTSSDTANYIPDGIPGGNDLDNYGEWIDTDEYGRMWCPRGVGADWAPYRDGYWRWFSSYDGWTWVSSEPWGWTPYHYGRWAYARDRWCWAPFTNIDPEPGWRWRPHHVVFFGWGGDHDRDYRGGDREAYWKGFRDGHYGWLGWCPLSPRDMYLGPRDNPPRLEALGNFRAPRAVSGMDASRFTGGRAQVSREFLNAPLPAQGEISGRPRGEKDSGAVDFVRNEDLKPLQRITPTRSDAVARGRFALRIEAPIIFRHSPGGALTPGSGPNRQEGQQDVQRTPSPFRRDTDSKPTTNGRIDAPSRPPDSGPAKRVVAPPPLPGESRETRDRRDGAPPRNEPPSRDEKRFRDEKRYDDAPRHPEPAAIPDVERRDPHHPEERRETRRPDPPSRDNSPQETRRPVPPSADNSPRETRRPDPPSRDNSPRNVEQPSSPPLRSAPPRQPERPSSPPPAKSRPSAPTPRSAPPRQPDRPSSPPPVQSRPSAPPPQSAPSRPSSPPPQSAPSRPSSPPPQSAPSRPSSPPPQSAPSRPPERPSSPPPARESAPSRPAESPASPRKPNGQ